MCTPNWNFKAVDVDEWSDYLSQFRTYKTEYNYGRHSVMYSRFSGGPFVGCDCAEVHYCENGERFYFIIDPVKKETT